MRVLRAAAPIGAAYAVIGLVTTILWGLQHTESVNLLHPIFFYLLPIALLAILFGSLPAMLSTLAALLCASFFLYEPIYSFAIANTLGLGDLICFVLLALIGIKCTVELTRPITRRPAAKTRLRRLRL